MSPSPPDNPAEWDRTIVASRTMDDKGQSSIEQSTIPAESCSEASLLIQVQVIFPLCLKCGVRCSLRKDLTALFDTQDTRCVFL